MLDCHIQPVAREGWQAAGCVFFASEYPTIAAVCWLFLPLGKPRLLVTKLFSAALRATGCLALSPKTSNSPRDHTTGVSSRYCCQCLSCVKCRWLCLQCKRASFVSSLLCELACPV
ncbi:unnamed protein product [Effrenium voratum]|uniref:Uncharacterized protein n=1 Tax=Effrenium voratum TaxID=2562239 RepID=A0AA36NHX7_9DINO|nr:unnamed protein product [Effrenium voratum]